MDVISAVITGGAVIIAAVVALFGVLYGHLSSRIGALEDNLEDERSYNRRLWSYCRYLIDLYYRHRGPGAPELDPMPDEHQKEDRP